MEEFFMSEKQHDGKGTEINIPCKVDAETQIPFKDEKTKPILVKKHEKPIIKVPALLAEPKIQIVVEADIPLNPPAVEIKRVLKDVFLTQCKLVPVKFNDKYGDHYGVREVKRAKLFVEGFIRKNIEYAAADCNGVIHDRIANVHFSGFADLKDEDFFLNPILGETKERNARFINPKNSDIPRLDKYFFENSVFYNEQPYCELVEADFFELDFSPSPVEPNEPFKKLREKIVLDLTVKVLQLRQVKVDALGFHHHKHDDYKHDGYKNDDKKHDGYKND